MDQPGVKVNGHPMMGEMFRHRRRKLGLSMRELAQKAGLSSPYLSVLETDQYQRPSDDVIRRVCAVLELDAAEILAKKYLSMIPPDLRPLVARMIADS